ncbi:MAG: extracellular solute-binding protein [Solirubrobacteraceae bacterium]
MRLRSIRAKAAAIGSGALMTCALAACGSSSSSSTPASTAPSSTTSAAASGSTSASASGHGKVSVLYAGSLTNLMEHGLGAAFTQAEGYQFEGVGAGSDELVSQIKGKVRRGDVFISASPKANKKLQGAANDNYVSWYATFAKAPLLIAYNPHSRFAAKFRSEPWYKVITQAGIRVGRTDPKLDPKGKLTVEAATKAAAMLKMPALTKAKAKFAVFPEETLVGRLQSGQLDAGFFYANEATQEHLQTVSLAPVSASASYTVSVLRGAPDEPGAAAFVKYLLGPSGKAMLAKSGLTVLPSMLTGSPAAVPVQLRSRVGG